MRWIRFSLAKVRRIFVFLCCLCATLVFLQSAIFGQDWKPQYGIDAFQPVQSQTCPKKHFVFVNVHQCSATPVTSVLRRYALAYNLTMALSPPNLPRSFFERGLGFPDLISPKYIYRLGGMKHRGIPLETSFLYQRFNLETWQSVMPRDSVYLAVMREPLDQLRSLLAFIERFKEPYQGQILDFFANPNAHHFYVKQEETTFTWTKNFMAFTLGFPQNAAMKDAGRYLQHIDGAFDLVLLAEYLMESMVLLRRKMCWPMRDVVFMPLKTRENEKVTFTEELQRKSRAWNKVDHLFYDHFKRKLFDDISKEKDFQKELQRFKEVNMNINRFCESLTKNGTQFYVVPESDWNEGFTFTKHNCLALNGTNVVMGEMRKRLDGIIDLRSGVV